MLDGSLAGVEISAHDDKGLRLVAHEVSDELIYRFEYLLLLVEVTQVNIYQVRLEGLVGRLYEKDLVRSEGFRELRRQVAEHDAFN